MVSRIKDINNPPQKLLLPKWQNLKDDVLLTRNNHGHKSSCYRDSSIEELKTLYKNKCAYCERVYGDELEVDHYRPKKERQIIGEPKFNQPGYYWLSYEWSNLILCCSKCNGNKSNKFPLVGWNELSRVFDHISNVQTPNYNAYDFNWLQNHEDPLLLNPESDNNFESHLRYFPSGAIRGITDKGKATIDICDLNRGWLITQRKKIIDEYVIEINEAINDYDLSKNLIELKIHIESTFKRIQRHTQDDYPFSLFHNYISVYFKFFIGNNLEISIKERICNYWDDFRNQLK